LPASDGKYRAFPPTSWLSLGKGFGWKGKQTERDEIGHGTGRRGKGKMKLGKGMGRTEFSPNAYF